MLNRWNSLKPGFYEGINPVYLPLMLVGAGASRPAGGRPRPAYPPDFQGAGIPRRRTDRGGVGRALGCGRACPDCYGRAVREGDRLKAQVLLREALQPRRSPYAQMPRQRRPKELGVDAPGVPVQVDGKQEPLRSETAPIRRSKLLRPLDKRPRFVVS